MGESSSVDEYQIDPEGSSFRHWSEPTVTNKNHNIIVSDCFTAMTFETDNINGHVFNVSGIEDLIWGGNSKDYHVGYHGRGNRARFYVNWLTGDAWFWEKPKDDDDDGHGGHGSSHDDKDEEEVGEEVPMTDEDDSGGAYHNRLGGSASLISIVS